jgi:GGDEF domain-containing protein
MTVFKYIKTLFNKEPSSLQPLAELPNSQLADANEIAPIPTATSAPLAPEDRLAELVDQRVDTSRTVVVGYFELLGLDEIKDTSGPSGPALAARAVEITENGIRQRISDRDVLQNISRTEFSVCFAEASREAAIERAKQISLAISQELNDEIPEATSIVTFKQYVTEIDLGKLAENKESLADSLILILHRMRDEADGAAANYRRQLLSSFQLLFAPLWDHERSVVDLNRCVLDLSLGCATLSQFRAIADPDQMADTLADMDCMALTRALETLHRYGKASNVAAVLVPVGYQTLVRRSNRREYLKLLASIPEPYAPFVQLEVTRVPQRPNIAQLNESIAAIADRRPRVTLQVHGNAAYIKELDPSPLWALSYHLPSEKLRGPGHRPIVPSFIEYAKNNNLRTMAHGANTIGLALAAVESGFNYVSGTAIHLAQDTPRATSRLHPLTFPKRLSK